MQKIFHNKRLLFPLFAILLIASGVLFFQQPTKTVKSQISKRVQGISLVSTLSVQHNVPSPSISQATPSTHGIPKTLTVQILSPIPYNSPTQNPSTPKVTGITSVQNIPTVQPIITTIVTDGTLTINPSPTVTPSPPITPTPTKTVAKVSLQISEPDGTSTTTVDLSTGANTCDVLTEAKNEGKIKSLTFDSSYLATFHSLYVKEMNGYVNNWTFSVNGASPQGCSLYTPKPNDTIFWKFD